ncbi:galactose metabolism- protein [Hypoxylon texense]
MYKKSTSPVTLLLLPTLLLLYGVAVNAIPDPIICEDSLDGTSPPFDSRDVPCLLGCGVPVAVATGSLLPGSVNETDIPYCQLSCVRDDATPAQSAAAPGCRASCGVMNQGTPENIGWCMYWCVDGYSDLVETTACVPSLTYGDEVTTTDGSWTITVYESPGMAELVSDADRAAQINNGSRGRSHIADTDTDTKPDDSPNRSRKQSIRGNPDIDIDIDWGRKWHRIDSSTVRFGHDGGSVTLCDGGGEPSGLGSLVAGSEYRRDIGADGLIDQNICLLAWCSSLILTPDFLHNRRYDEVN